MSRRMVELRDSFPSLAGRFGPEFSVDELAEFLLGPAATSGSSAAAKFVLSVWLGTTGVRWDTNEEKPEIDTWRWPWPVVPFDLHRALGCWDPAHTRAFLAWAQEPWWP